MAVTDIDARFDHVEANAGTLAYVVREEMRAAAHRISDAAGEGDDPRVTAVVQHLEMAAHTAGRYLNQPAQAEEEPAETESGDGLDALSVEDIREQARGRDLPASGSKAALVRSIREHDARQREES